MAGGGWPDYCDELTLFLQFSRLAYRWVFDEGAGRDRGGGGDRYGNVADDFGENAIVNTHLSLPYHTLLWMLVAIPLGIAAGLLGVGFTSAIVGFRGWVKDRTLLPVWIRPAMGGLMGCFGLAGFFSGLLALKALAVPETRICEIIAEQDLMIFTPKISIRDAANRLYK